MRRRAPRVIPSTPNGVVAGSATDPYRVHCTHRYGTSWTAPYHPDDRDAYWQAHVERRFKLDGHPAGWIYLGDCPRCCHPIDVVVRRDAFEAGSAASVELVCNCVATHAGAPAGRTGCGRTGRIKFDLFIGR